MRWCSALSEAPDTAVAVRQALSAIDAGLGGSPAQLLLVFATMEHGPRMGEILDALVHAHPRAARLGCTAAGVIGAGEEREAGPALSILAAHLPDVAVGTFHLGARAMSAGPEDPARWHELLGVEPGHDPALIVIAEPYSTPIDRLLARLDEALPGAPKVGGLASGAQVPGGNRMICGDRLRATGAVGVALYGDIRVQPVVSQGCRPIGPRVQIERCHRNVVQLASGEPAFALVEKVYQGLSPYDRELFRKAPLVGVLPSADPGAAEVLVRNIVGFDRGNGSFALSHAVQPGQHLQLQLRDGRSADRELSRMLELYLRAAGGSAPAAALLFSCVGRGEGLYGVSGHDSRVFSEMTASAPIGGFFCAGEIGPIQRQSHLHGFTSAFAMVRPRGWS